MESKNNWKAWLYLAPVIILMAVFTFYPIVNTIGISFLKNYDTLTGTHDGFTFDNYLEILHLKPTFEQGTMKLYEDEFIKVALPNTLLITFVTVPLSIIIALAIAIALNSIKRLQKIFQTIFFMPYVTNIVAIATVWQALFHKTKGPINVLLMILGITEEALPGWLSSSDWALLAVAIVLVWKDIGYDILMYSGALQSIPKELYEAADMDGAGPITKFFKITLPQLKPTTFMLTILGIVSSLQMWSFVQIITGGGPGTATYTLGLYIYRSAFITYKTGYACALAWFLCALVMIFTIIRNKVEQKYENE